MPRFLYPKGHQFEGKTRYVCDECNKNCGGGFVKIVYKAPAIVLCSIECKEKYEKSEK